MYWFRTPPGVRVGRAALDEDAIRLIEEHNPRIQFDWTRILKGQAEAEETPPPFTDERHKLAARPTRSVVERPAPSAPPKVADGAPPTSSVADVEVEPLEVTSDHDDAPGPETLEVVAAAAIDHAAALDQPATPAQARLGSEGLQRLRGRYADIMAGIHDRVPDGPRKDELKAQAERLNPDSWVTEEEVRLGLEQYESVFESLRPLAVRRRRRRRRRPGNPL